MEMINKIKFTKDDTLYILGDMIDRGDKPIEVLKYAMANKNVFALRGNHEGFMIDNDLWSWIMNGGRKTIEDLSKLKDDEREEILKFVSELPLLKTIEVKDNTFCLVHAGVQINDSGEIIEKQNQDFLLWAREEYMNQSSNHEEIIVSGHTPTFYMTKSDKSQATVFKDRNKIFIDCGCAYGGRLACVRLNDLKVFYV